MKTIIIDTLKRIISKNPKYFQTLQIICGILAVLCFAAMGAEKYFPEQIPDVVVTISNDIWGYVVLLIGAFQLPHDDSTTAK